MKIEVLGSGCPKCKQLEKNVKSALETLKKSADVVKVTEIKDIIAAGVMMTPALRVDGKLVSEGRIPNEAELTELLK